MKSLPDAMSQKVLGEATLTTMPASAGTASSELLRSALGTPGDVALAALLLALPQPAAMSATARTQGITGCRRCMPAGYHVARDPVILEALARQPPSLMHALARLEPNPQANGMHRETKLLMHVRCIADSLDDEVFVQGRQDDIHL